MRVIPTAGGVGYLESDPYTAGGVGFQRFSVFTVTKSEKEENKTLIV